MMPALVTPGAHERFLESLGFRVDVVPVAT